MSKMKKYRFIVLLFALFVAVGLSFAQYVRKAQADIINLGTALQITYTGSGPIFSELNLAPGDVVDKNLQVKNIGTIGHSFAIATQNVVPSSVTYNLADKITIEAFVNGSVTPAWTETILSLSTIPSGSKVIVSNIDPDDTVDVDLRATLDTSTDNNYQSAGVAFDVVFGTEEAEPTATATGTVSATATTTTTTTATTTATQTVTSTATVSPLATNTPTQTVVPTSTPSATSTTTVPGVVTTSTATPLTTTIVVGRVSANLAPATSATVAPTSSATGTVLGATATAVTGEVKGEQTGGGSTGEDWRLLLIVPIVGILSAFLIRSKVWRSIVLPIAAGLGAFILSFFYKGTLATWLFFLILIVEVIIFIVLESLLRKESQSDRADNKS